MAASSSSFGSPERPSPGRRPGSKNKLRSFREVLDDLLRENFGSVEAGHKALVAQVWQQALGSVKAGVKADFRYLQLLVLYAFGKPPEDLATQQKLDDAREMLAAMDVETKTRANGTQCRP